MTELAFDPLVPRPIDLYTTVPATGRSTALDGAKILAAPDDPADWPAWRARLAEWRDEARARTAYDGAAYEVPGSPGPRAASPCALVWLWDDLLYDHEAGRFTPDRLLDEAEREFGGWDALVLWHAYPVIGIDERNQFDFYRDVPGIRELVSTIQASRREGVRRLQPVGHGHAARAGRRRGGRRRPGRASSAPTGCSSTRCARRCQSSSTALPGVALEGESTLPLERIADHHLSWAQWFADSPVPGVIRARWFEQRHMLHHTRRWNRSHSDELRSAWLNGVGMLVWENVFGAWVGWSERDRRTLRGDDSCAAPARAPAHARELDAARRAQRRRVRRRLALEPGGRGALGAREPPATSRSRARVDGVQLELPGRGLAAIRPGASSR